MKKTPYKSKHVEVGDVITSSKFANGEYDSSGRITVGHSNPSKCFGNGVDKTRATAEYVVESAGMGGGGTGMGPHDVYPDGWDVTARRLKKDGTYDPNGEVISFYQSGCFTCMVPTVTVVRKLKKVVNFVPA